MLVWTRVWARAVAAATGLAATAGSAMAADPRPWGIEFQAAATPVMAEIRAFNDLVLIIIVAIGLFVMALLGYVIVRFRAHRNPTPTRTSHNTPIEVAWTVVPIIILIIIGIPSLKLLYFTDKATDAEMTIEATGRQWYWSYAYPDEKIEFDSTMIAESDLKPGQPRLLTVDNNLVIPVGTTVRVLVTASDVLHAFAVPAAGVKLDAVPGKINETWFRFEAEGVHRGQCSELCGVGHGFMPIVVEVVSKDDYRRWLAGARERFAAAGAVAAPVARLHGPN